MIFSSKHRKASAGMSKSSGAPRSPPITKDNVAKLFKDSDFDSELISHSWTSRIFKVALHFQLALVALFCAAYLLEPHCCETAYTLWSLVRAFFMRFYEKDMPPV